MSNNIMKDSLGNSAYILGLLIFLAACITCRSNSLQETGGEAFQEKVDEFIANGLEFRLGKTRAEIVRNLGNPRSIKIRKVPNVHYPEELVAEIHELFYDGLVVRLCEATEVNKEFLEYFSVTSDRYKVKWGLNIGTHKDRVRYVLGTPTKEEESLYAYKYLMGYPHYVYFYFRDDRVYEIAWEFWID